MNKGRRNELRDLNWKRRLDSRCLKRTNPKDHILFRDQACPCSCSGCRGEKYSRSKQKRDNDSSQDQ